MARRFTLNTGAEIPAIGFGTWQDEGAQEEAVLEALRVGYRHVDTARIYGTEKAIGRAIQRCDLPRNELFISTKLWNNKHHPDDVQGALQESLDDLGLEYVDLYMMHWPVAWKRGEDLFPKQFDKIAVEEIDMIDTYKAMEKLLKTGKVKAIGVSNFCKAEMERLLRNTTIVPAVHQMECHPWLQQLEFTSWHRTQGIHITQYSPFGNQNTIYRGKGGATKLIDEPVLGKIGAQYNKSGAQVSLAWGITQGHSVLPKSKTSSRIQSNFESDFKLSPENMQEIRKLNRKIRFNDSSYEFGREFFQDLEDKT